MNRTAGVVLVVALAAALVLPGAGFAQEEQTYRNPVSRGVVDAFPDPAIIRGGDGYWYAYGTTDPVRQSKGDDDFHFLPIMRSKDMVEWDYMGDVFTETTRPTWHPSADTFYWAPDVRYMNGKYYLYYSVAHFGDDELFTIGVATAPSPTGPWTDSGGEVIDRDSCDTNPIDPAEFTDKDGKRYLYWGSYGDICVALLTPDGLRVAGDATRVTYGGQAEAAYVIRRGRYYYLFISEGACCSGALSSYEVLVGRSTDPLGPFVDKQGVSMLASRRGGSFVMSANGNRWVGPGHHSMATDLAGRTWAAYHAIDKNNDFLNPPYDDISRRPLMIDPLDWVRGWPTVRAGRWASAGRQRAPVTSWTAGGDFNSPESLDTDWVARGAGRAGWRLAEDPDHDGYATQTRETDKPAYLVTKASAPARARVEADLRTSGTSNGAVGVVAAYRDRGNHFVAWLNERRHALVTNAVVDGRRTVHAIRPLPESFRFDEWHNVAVQLRGSSLNVQVTEARLGDPVARIRRHLPPGVTGSGAAGIASLRASALGDNAGGAPLYHRARETAPPPNVGEEALENFSDEFNDARLDPEWSFVREPAGEQTGGVYRFPTQGADLFEDINDATVVRRKAPSGNYTVQTKMAIDLGVDTDKSFQQAGLVMYSNDDRYLKLVHVSIGPDRRTEFAKEDPFYESMVVGAPARVTWFRISHRVDRKHNEQELRAASSRNGKHWAWGGVWTLPLGAKLDIGLVSQGGEGSTARFDYVRTFRP
ncbi:MAG: family 43 glycosylhydrolase [Actinobacteria bacterium]|nr:family 43 glycosylhydrolase [Actinomycetota bacterium]